MPAKNLSETWKHWPNTHLPVSVIAICPVCGNCVSTYICMYLYIIPGQQMKYLPTEKTTFWWFSLGFLAATEMNDKREV